MEDKTGATVKRLIDQGNHFKKLFDPIKASERFQKALLLKPYSNQPAIKGLKAIQDQLRAALKAKCHLPTIITVGRSEESPADLILLKMGNELTIKQINSLFEIDKAWVGNVINQLTRKETRLVFLPGPDEGSEKGFQHFSIMIEKKDGKDAFLVLQGSESRTLVSGAVGVSESPLYEQSLSNRSSEYSWSSRCHEPDTWLQQSNVQEEVRKSIADYIDIKLKARELLIKYGSEKLQGALDTTAELLMLLPFADLNAVKLHVELS
ncbi:MAG: hypothetical protein K8F91_18090, partial [Candidatus Obscuribacterales bacterium]|nr:hypothetical protein [Candidatus Obscuribacterales bacterium]